MIENRFFEERSEWSEVKATIVEDYFYAWANVIVSHLKKSKDTGKQKLAYVDLFSGPGRYADGKPSTPLLVLRKALHHPDLPDRLVTVFNDRNRHFTETLRREIESLPNIELLRHKPRITNEEVGDRMARVFEEIKLPPTLLFVDPCGYKGFSLRLVASVLKDWGCDCIFFFNYNRINMHLSNPRQEGPLEDTLGADLSGRLHIMVEGLAPFEREMMVVNETALEMGRLGAKYVLPFCFKNKEGDRTSHHLIFVTKHFLGYDIMKDVMARYSSERTQGIPTFVYAPAGSRYQMLFEFTRPMDQLAEMLLKCFAGRTLRMSQIYEEHSVGRPYVRANYREVLNRLETEGRVTADPPASKRRKGTFANRVVVTFPPKEP
jgi:three-Cys-motif partner protein